VPEDAPVEEPDRVESPERELEHAAAA